jgi:uncharacterized membrane protein
MTYAVLKLIHLLCVIVWVGGMVFAQFFLRPSLAVLDPLDPTARFRLMAAVLSRFLNAVLAVSTLTVASGGWMLGRVAQRTAQAGLPFNMPLDWWAMALLGVFMWLVFGHIRFVLHARLRRAVAASDWPGAARLLVRIRHWVMFNLGLGLGIVTAVVVGSAS